MAPFKSTGGFSVGKLLKTFRNRDLTVNSSVRTYRGPVLASGGTIATPGNGYKYHIFTYPNTDDFVLTSPAGATLEVLIVAGGGGGSTYPTGSPGSSGGAGGGGAGGIGANGGDGVVNTGSGGGGQEREPGPATQAGRGGSGIVLIAYPS